MRSPVTLETCTQTRPASAVPAITHIQLIAVVILTSTSILVLISTFANNLIKNETSNMIPARNTHKVACFKPKYRYSPPICHWRLHAVNTPDGRYERITTAHGDVRGH